LDSHKTLRSKNGEIFWINSRPINQLKKEVYTSSHSFCVWAREEPFQYMEYGKIYLTESIYNLYKIAILYRHPSIDFRDEGSVSFKLS